MKKISNLSLVGYFFGLLLIISATIRYFIVYPDYSQAFQFVVNGALICSVAWLYDRVKSQGNTIMALEEYLADGVIE